jgi:putative glutamine amidotransferase
VIIGFTNIEGEQDSLDNYLSWVGRSAPGATLRILASGATPQEEIEECHGILLTGGGDVHPGSYGREDALRVTRNVRGDRDEFEFGVIRQALAAGKPILGICRGCQVFNVALGGSLIPDLPAAGYQPHSRGEETTRVHPILLIQGSTLRSILGTGAGSVNTSHHQAVLLPGKDLCVAALSDDNVVESVEWEDPRGRPWILMVQWHPERAWGMEHSFSEKILGAFLRAVKQQK